MGSVSKAWSADGDNDVITNGYGAHPVGDGRLPSASGERGGSVSAPGAAVFGAAVQKNDVQRTPPGATFASSSADQVRDFLGLGADGPPSWARHSDKQASKQLSLSEQAKQRSMVRH